MICKKLGIRNVMKIQEVWTDLSFGESDQPCLKLYVYAFLNLDPIQNDAFVMSQLFISDLMYPLDG